MQLQEPTTRLELPSFHMTTVRVTHELKCNLIRGNITGMHNNTDPAHMRQGSMFIPNKLICLKGTLDKLLMTC